MDKTSEEYANKLAEDYTKVMDKGFVEYAKEDFAKGYLTAIEENNVKGLRESNSSCLSKLNEAINYEGSGNSSSTIFVLRKYLIEAKQALEKAKTINTTE